MFRQERPCARKGRCQTQIWTRRGPSCVIASIRPAAIFECLRRSVGDNGGRVSGTATSPSGDPSTLAYSTCLSFISPTPIPLPFLCITSPYTPIPLPLALSRPLPIPPRFQCLLRWRPFLRFKRHPSFAGCPHSSQAFFPKSPALRPMKSPDLNSRFFASSTSQAICPIADQRPQTHEEHSSLTHFHFILVAQIKRRSQRCTLKTKSMNLSMRRN